MSGPSHSKSPLTVALVLAAVFVLVSVVLSNNAQLLNAELQGRAEKIWPGYNTKGLTAQKPACDLKELEAQKAEALKTKPKTPATGDDDLLDDLVDGTPNQAKPAPKDDDSLLDDLVEDTPAKTAPKQVKKQDDDDLLDGLVDEAGAESKAAKKTADDDDLLDGLVDDKAKGTKKTDKASTTNGSAVAKAFEKAIGVCKAKHEAYARATRPESDGESSFRAIQEGAASLKGLGDDFTTRFLVLLFLICGLVTVIRRHHIALRPPESVLDDRVAEGAQLVTNVLLVYSFWVHRGIGIANKATPEETWVNTTWVVGFAVLGAFNAKNLLTPSPNLKTGGNLFRSLLSIPLYAMMCLIAGSYFLLAEGHGSGLAIYLSKLNQNALLYLNVGLYVWVGMMLKGTRIATLCFDAVRPWRLPPEVMAFVVVVGAALPTAYSGASGIFVIAVGAVIFDELIRAGARRQLALAATAMSGSMGVVLRPCLLVVIVASLNKEVTTDQLYHWGFRVFLLSAFLFLVVALLNRQPAGKMAPFGQATRGTASAFKPILPYIFVFAGIAVVYSQALSAHLDEDSAPFILPAILMAFLCMEAWRERRQYASKPQALGGASQNLERPQGFFARLAGSTDETAGHIGALLSLMGLSVCLGGIIERADVMALVPETFGSIWITMGILVLVLVVVGMTMDPYGAVILVSATIAAVAYRNGIDPVHFWMVVLVAFELGYLTPPVALNHLLTRQVVGEAAFVRQEGEDDGSFYARNERILLPIIVMGITLLLVAFVPLWIGY